MSNVQTQNPISIAQAIVTATQQLQFSETAKLDSEILLLKVLNKSASQLLTKSWLLTWPEKLLSLEQWQQFKQYLELRSSGMPIAYIAGEKDFWTFKLKVTADTLIPRPETELLVECALDKISTPDKMDILDLGTGSGAIALAIASERQHCRILATDNSQAALDIAQHNAHLLQLNNVKFLKSYWFEEFKAITQKFDIIVSNPPYIAENDPLLEANVRQYEPLQALISNDNGLQDIKQIIQNSLVYLKPQGWILFEHAYNQAEEVQRLLEIQGFSKINSIKDLNHQPRVTFAQWYSP